MLNCRQVNELSSLYIDKKNLTCVQRANIYIHVMMCKHCRVFIAQMTLLNDSFTQRPIKNTVTEQDIEQWVKYLQHHGVKLNQTSQNTSPPL